MKRNSPDDDGKKLDENNENIYPYMFNLEVCYCTADSDGFVSRQDFSTQAPYHTPLIHAIRAVIPDKDKEFIAYEGHSKGNIVDLDQNPLQSPFITDALRNGTKLVLFVTDLKPVNPESSKKNNMLSKRFSGSMMVRRSQNRKDEISPLALSTVEGTPPPDLSASAGYTESSRVFRFPQRRNRLEKVKTLPNFSGNSKEVMKTFWDLEPPLESEVESKPTLLPLRLTRRQAFRRRSHLPQDCQLSISTEKGDCKLINFGVNKTVGDLEAEISSMLPGLGQHFILTYTSGEKTYELHKKSQFLWQSLLEENQRNLMVKIPSPPGQKEVLALLKISELTGGSQNYIADTDQPAVDYARKTLYNYVMEVTKERDVSNYSLSPELMDASESLPISISLKKIPYSNKLSITFHYQDIFSLTKSVYITTHATQLLRDIFSCLVACKLIEDDIENYVLQVTGVESCIHGDHEIMCFKHIRNFIVKGEQVHLSVVKKPSIKLYQPFIFDRPIPDAHSMEDLHSNVTFTDIGGVLYPSSDMKDNYRLTLSRVTNLSNVSSRVKWQVEVSLHYSATTLHGPLHTPARRPTGSEVIWDEVLEFEVKIRDIPREAKVLLVARVGGSATFYWTMFSIYNHEGVLQRGRQILTFWEGTGPEQSSKLEKTRCLVEEVSEVFSPVLAGPAASSPLPSAISITIVLPEDYQTLPTEENESQTEKRTSYQLRKHFQHHRNIKFTSLRQQDGYYRDLSRHLLLVNWDKLVERQEVHRLLEDLSQDTKEIPIYVALKLLDSGFPDINVRRFATKILEAQLSDEELEHYLLQLTQAVKFECCHDSPLARFLLKKALNNKIIGHYFFWYLRSELCLRCVPRFTVLLEAYLTGCGEAMLTRFKDQLKVDDLLDKMQKKLKDAHNKDVVAMQAALPRALLSQELDKMAFTPVCSPRLVLGNIRPEKCKIMSSAKRPLWLEMMNVSKSVVSPTPKRMIRKVGDDLRQDMITLRMLSLFDKLWQAGGLDLKLLPYGCMATGPRGGFIEVVNAKTISEVSGLRQNSKLYQWIRSHQTNEFGDIDPQKLEQATKTFIHSCAGYSVATYTLGIGDRHNDNIMITTSGNLFHIDFGHFLGNIKYCMKFKREWAPFVLTPDFIYVMGGENSKDFELYNRLCCRAFLILRRNADLIINLFSLMKSTGIPELTCVEDIDYIRHALVLDKTDVEAERCFQNVIKKCIDLGWTVQLMWAFHNKMRQNNKGSS